MKAAKLIAPKTHRFIETAIPEIDEFEVLVKVSICGLCASELEKWQSGKLEFFDYMGHEIVGIVEKVGKYVSNVKPGDRVTGLITNAFAEYAKAHHSLVVKVPENLSDSEAIGEPLGCLVSGVRQTDITIGDKVCIIGLGYMGLGFLSLLACSGASEITAIDVREESLIMAKKLGATKVMTPMEVTNDMKVVNYGENMDGGFDVVVEASGNEKALIMAYELAGLHKKVSIVGFHQNGTRTLDVGLQNWKAITTINAHERRDDFMADSIRRGLDLVASGRINTKDFITHTYDFEDLDKGFEEFLQKKNGYIKGVVKISK